MRESSSSSLTRSLWRAQRFLVRALVVVAVLLVLTPPSYPLALQPPDIGLGAFLAERSHAYLVDEMDFEWLVWTLEWKLAEPSEGNYDWFGLDQLLTAAENLGLQVVLRVTSAPDWARSSLEEAAPPDDMSDLGNFMYTLASHAQGKVAGYVIWNEPNLPIYWGGSPSPAQYVNMLSVVYPQIKAGDPNAAVVTAGMATTGGAGGAACGVGASMAAEEIGLYTQQLYAAGAMNDLDFICGIYHQGGKGYFDVLGSHPYGFAYEPERDPSSVNGLAFRRVEQQRAVMESQDDSGKEIWALESGWILDPGLSCRTWGDWPTRTWQIVSEHTQADYLERAFRYAGGHWPWMGMMSLFNMDFAAMYWYDYCHPVRWYSITYRENHLDPGNSPILYREGYYALQVMQMDLDPRAYLPLVLRNPS
ncbi:MAG: beta-galactosidase [Anaerolineae bacterium]